MPVTLEHLAADIADAHRTATPRRIIGGGTWLDAGRPCTGTPLPVRDYSGIVEYTPGDLTLTARAGTTLAELREATAAHDQWLGLDPCAAPDATLGATVATASDGPLAISYGRVRDLVLGLECISGTGEVLRAGGRVVKNVAGFDLVRLHTGAWGTLGVITEVTMRLRALPVVDRTFVITGDDRASLESRLAPLADMRIAPFALELLSPALAAALGVHDRLSLLVRLAGNEERVEAQRQALDALGDVQEHPGAVFDRLAEREPTGVPVARISHTPALMASTWRHVLDQCSARQSWQPHARASITRGVVRVTLPQETGDAASARDWATFVRTIAPSGAHVTWERLPSHAWTHVPSPVSDRLSRGIRRTLDPAHILNRGIFGEETADSAHAATIAGAVA